MEYVCSMFTNITWSAYDVRIKFFEKDLDHRISNLCHQQQQQQNQSGKNSLFVVFSFEFCRKYCMRSHFKRKLNLSIRYQKKKTCCLFALLLVFCSALFTDVVLLTSLRKSLASFDMKTKRTDNVYGILRIEFSSHKWPDKE